MKLDLHLHSEYSWDSKVKIEEYIKKAENKNYQIISITDHNNIESHNHLEKLQENTSVHLLPGQEVSTADGHLLVYGWIDTLPQDLTMKETVEIAHKSETICIAAHPFDPFRGGSFSKIFDTGIDGLELLNASAWFNFPNWLAKRAYQGYPELIGLANSDSHRISEFGSAYSRLEEVKGISEHNFEQIKQSLKSCSIHGSRIGIFRKISRLIRRI